MKGNNLYIIAGCNGAGKTTASYTILPEVLDCKEFVNADEIARGISPFQPEKVAFEAGRIMINRINELLNQCCRSRPREWYHLFTQILSQRINTFIA